MSASHVVLLLLALAGLLAVQAADDVPKPGMFADFMNKQTSSKAKAASYYEVQTETACLKEVAYRNCRTCAVPGDDSICAQAYIEAKVGCCHHDDYDKYGDSDDVLSEKLTVGVCSYKAKLFGNKKEITYEGTATVKVGTFTATCELKDDSDKCGSPFCEGMSIEVTGDMLQYPYVAFLHKPDAFDFDQSCKDAVSGPLPDIDSSRTPAKIQDYDYYEKPKFWVGKGEILSGTFYTLSRHHKMPYKVGQFQLTYALNPTAENAYKPEHELSEKAFVAKDHAISLEFIKEDSA